MLNDTDDLKNILIELPADAQNITVTKIDNNSTEIIPEEDLELVEAELEDVENEYDIPKAKKMKLDEIAHKHNATYVVPLDYAKLKDLKEVKHQDKPTKALLINETNIQISNVTLAETAQNQTEIEYKIQFETPAPFTTEQEYSTSIKFQKNVTVAHNSTLHYTNVRSYSDIPEDMIKKGMEFTLYWVVNGSKVDVTNDPRFAVTLNDTDTKGNGIVDKIEWNVPQLSEQDFIIEGIIKITNAIHLDSNREFIKDVFPTT